MNFSLVQSIHWKGKCGRETVKVRYDKEVDAAYIQLSSKKPDGAVEMAEGVILHTTSKNFGRRAWQHGSTR
jgi:hypothetical protein